MSESCSGGTGETRRAAVFNAADILAFAASPTFAGMALLTTFVGSGPAELICAPAHISPLSGMATMYLLMSIFHAGPWLKLIRARASVDRPSTDRLRSRS